LSLKFPALPRNLPHNPFDILAETFKTPNFATC